LKKIPILQTQIFFYKIGSGDAKLLLKNVHHFHHPYHYYFINRIIFLIIIILIILLIRNVPTKTLKALQK